MKINIFSGARRLALALAVLVTLVAIGLTAFNEPYVPINYTISGPGAPFVLSNDICPQNGDSLSITTSAPDKSNVYTTICILPMAFGEAGTELIPYKVENNGVIWGAEKYSAEVTAYKNQLEKRFRITPSDWDIIKSKKSSKYWKQWRETIQYLATGLAAYWLLIATLGWIVRGFVGIPLGKDFRDS